MEDWHNATEPLLINTPDPYPERVAPVGEAALAQSRRLAALAGSVRGPIELCRGGTLATRGLAEAAHQVAEKATDQAHELWLIPVLGLVRHGHSICRVMRDARAGSRSGICWFLLEGVGPELLASLVRREGMLEWSELIGDPSIALMVGHDGPPESRVPASVPRMRHSLRVPEISVADTLAWCRCRQPAIEGWLGMPVEHAALEAAVGAATEPAAAWPTCGPLEEPFLARSADPERALSVLSAAASMVRFEWAHGPVRLVHLNWREFMDDQAELVTMARGGSPSQVLGQSGALERAALEVEWYEHPPELILDQAAVLSWLESVEAASSASDAFWYDARCLNKEVTRE